MANKQITYEDALKALDIHLEGRKKRVHTFEACGPILMGGDMDLTAVKKLLKNAQPDDLCISGPTMCAVNHGVGIWTDRGWLYISTQNWFKLITTRKAYSKKRFARY